MSASGSAESSDKSENSDRAKKQRTAHTPMDDADLRAACKELVAQANQMNDADLYAACKKLVDQGYPPGVQDTLLMLDGAQKRLEDTETIATTLRDRILQMVQREMSVKALKLKPKATGEPKSMPSLVCKPPPSTLGIPRIYQDSQTFLGDFDLQKLPSRDKKRNFSRRS